MNHPLSSVAVLQFTESDYSNSESLRVISPSIQLSTNIATDLIVEAVPLNFTFVNDSQLALPVTFPNFTPRRPFIATSKYQVDIFISHAGAREVHARLVLKTTFLCLFMCPHLSCVPNYVTTLLCHFL